MWGVVFWSIDSMFRNLDVARASPLHTAQHDASGAQAEKQIEKQMIGGQRNTPLSTRVDTVAEETGRKASIKIEITQQTGCTDSHEMH